MTTNAETPLSRLWDAKHPYYASDGCYWWSGSSGTQFPHSEHESWADFLAEMDDADLDYNLLYRWDWQVPDPAWAEPGEEPESETLDLFYMQQRKAAPWSHRIKVTRDQEPAIREWLTIRAEHLRKVWEPLLSVAAEGGDRG